MYKDLEQRLSKLQMLPPHVLTEGRLVGVEKESLRVLSDGGIAQSDHPESLGSALTNPYITTDYSEALLEFVTPPMADAKSALQFLENAHKFVYPRMPESETIWATSMPCVLDGNNSIRIGQYGTSNAGQMKHVYRRGLGLRYGRNMQAIAGIHFNFSLPADFWSAYQTMCGNSADTTEFVTAQYFHMTRNLLRYGWLVPYLFGASPAICKCFLDGRDPLPNMSVFNTNTYYEPFGTSLRMGDIGYQYAKDADVPITVSYADLDSYVADLYRLITTSHPRYTALGLRDDQGHYQQLNTNQLQIENEYYSSVRPKQVPTAGEMPLLAMVRRGIRYLELRSTDVNIFEPLGVSLRQLQFLEVFMLFSLVQQSDAFGPSDMKRLSHNMTQTAHRGRDPKLRLEDAEREIGLRDWGLEVLEQMVGPAELLDRHTDSSDYTQALAYQKEKLVDPERTPSARLIREMLDNFDSFYELAYSKSVEHATQLSSESMSTEDEAVFVTAAERSITDQIDMEQQDSIGFKEYLADNVEQLSTPELDAYRSIAEARL